MSRGIRAFGLSGALLGVVLGLLIVFAQTTGILGTGNRPKASFEGPLIHMTTTWKPVAEVRRTPDGRLFVVRKAVFETRSSPEGFPMKCWDDLIQHLASEGELKQCVDLLPAIAPDDEKGKVILALLPTLQGSVEIEQGKRWSQQPPPPVSPEQLHKLQEKYISEDAEPKPIDDGRLHFRVSVAERCAEVLQEIIAATMKSDDPVVRASVLAGIADYQLSSQEKWARATADKTVLAIQEAGAAQKTSLHYMWLWPALLGVVGFVAASLSKPLFEAIGAIAAVSAASVVGNERLMKALGEKDRKQ